MPCKRWGPRAVVTCKIKDMAVERAQFNVMTFHPSLFLWFEKSRGLSPCFSGEAREGEAEQSRSVDR